MHQSQTHPQKAPRPQARLPDPIQQCLATIVLGRFSANCQHFGICRVEAMAMNTGVLSDFSIKQTSVCGDKVAAIWSYQPPNSLELSLLNSTVSTTVFQRHFADGIFLMEEDYTLPKWLFGEPLVIQKGSHNIVISDSLMIIKLTNL